MAGQVVKRFAGATTQHSRSLSSGLRERSPIKPVILRDVAG